MSLFKKIGLFFTALFNSAKRAFKKLTPEQQAALKDGSGMIALLNKTINESPEKVRTAITEKFPDRDWLTLEKGLTEIAKAFNLIKPNSNLLLDELIVLLQGHLKKLEGKDWATASNFAANVFAIFLSPKGTKVAAIVSLMEWVYQHFFKKAA